MNLRTFSKYAVGLMLVGSVLDIAYQNHQARASVKEPQQAVRVDYGMVGDTIRQNPCGNSVLKIPDSVNVSSNDQFVRTATNQFEHLTSGQKSSGKSTIQGTLKAIKTIAMHK